MKLTDYVERGDVNCKRCCMRVTSGYGCFCLFFLLLLNDSSQTQLKEPRAFAYLYFLRSKYQRFVKQAGGSCRLVEVLLMSGAVGPTSEVLKNRHPSNSRVVAVYAAATVKLLCCPLTLTSRHFFTVQASQPAVFNFPFAQSNPFPPRHASRCLQTTCFFYQRLIFAFTPAKRNGWIFPLCLPFVHYRLAASWRRKKWMDESLAVRSRATNADNCCLSSKLHSQFIQFFLHTSHPFHFHIPAFRPVSVNSNSFCICCFAAAAADERGRGLTSTPKTSRLASAPCCHRSSLTGKVDGAFAPTDLPTDRRRRRHAPPLSCMPRGGNGHNTGTHCTIKSRAGFFIAKSKTLTRLLVALRQGPSTGRTAVACTQIPTHLW
ncbi:hypothetical protein T10_10548 [Trichinella papuae]|uniref:Uncharacterized protein n=1 Tax=Trichinella papuae TaxID=268474 RepID=A0A0V1MSL3_9BILA|nr:hypothetical protein T10_10548 [Trichinella papuae]